MVAHNCRDHGAERIELAVQHLPCVRRFLSETGHKAIKAVTTNCSCIDDAGHPRQEILGLGRSDETA